MTMCVVLGASLVALLSLSIAGFAADAGKPAAKGDAKDVKGVRLIKPFSELTDLTADQTIKLKEIHKKFSDEIKALEAQQKEEMMAVLTAEQKKELESTEKKASKGKMKDEAGATAGQPKDSAKDPAK